MQLYRNQYTRRINENPIIKKLEIILLPQLLTLVRY
jgi:hypothetical protein